MEIYKDLSNPASQEFEKLLSSQLSKVQIEEGKIIDGKINKITEKFVFFNYFCFIFFFEGWNYFSSGYAGIPSNFV